MELLAERPTPVLPASRAHWVADTLRQRIFDGVHPPGEWLRENAFCEEFGLSNGPVREGLQILVGEGLLERVPRRGMRVIDLSSAEIADLFELRLAMLEFAVELAANRRDSQAMREVPAVLEGIDEDAGRRPHLSGRLTEWVFAAAGNPRLSDVWKRAVMQSRLYMQAAAQRSHDFTEIAQAARQLVEAIAAGQPDGARLHARQLTLGVLDRLGISLDITAPGKARR